MIRALTILCLAACAAAIPLEAIDARSNVEGFAECALCKTAVGKGETYLESNATVQKLIGFGDELCDDLPAALKGECDALVAQYMLPAIEALLEKATPEKVCNLLDMCNSTSTIRLGANPISCRVCEAAVKRAEASIESNETVTKLTHWADGICQKAPESIAPICEAVVDKYVGQLLQLLISKADPKDVCVAMNQCAKSTDVDAERNAMIAQINSSPGVKWTAAVHPRFQGTPVGSVKSLCGVKNYSAGSVKSWADKATEEDAPAVDIPESFDSATNWPNCAEVIGDIRDQSNCGCCWAFAAAEAASDRLCIATDGKAKLPLSAESLCFCASDDGCDGGDILTPWQFIKDEGLVTGGQFQGTGPFGAGFCSPFSLPHCHHHGPQGSDPYPAEGQPGCPSESSPSCPKTCDSSASGDHTNYESDKYTFSGRVVTYDGEEQIQRAIMSGGPVEAAFTVYSDFENYAGGIYHHVTGELAGGHAIKIVGWGVEDGTKYWKVANSWNPYWGEKGYFRIKRGTDECGIESQSSSASSSAKWKGAGI